MDSQCETPSFWLDRLIFFEFFYELLVPAPISFSALTIILLIDENIVFVHVMRSLISMGMVETTCLQCPSLVNHDWGWTGVYSLNLLACSRMKKLSD